jgi:hypothetical protein
LVEGIIASMSELINPKSKDDLTLTGAQKLTLFGMSDNDIDLLNSYAGLSVETRLFKSRFQHSTQFSTQIPHVRAPLLSIINKSLQYVLEDLSVQVCLYVPQKDYEWITISESPYALSDQRRITQLASSIVKLTNPIYLKNKGITPNVVVKLTELAHDLRFPYPTTGKEIDEVLDLISFNQRPNSAVYICKSKPEVK